MTHRIATAALALGLIGSLAAAAPAAAGRYGWHPRRNEVNGRLFNQNQRIRAGVRDGQLTHAEAQSLGSNDRNIYREERTMAHLDGGHITRADQRSLNQQENANSRDIYADRHN